MKLSSPFRSTYRAEIDGLRAFAVLSVLFYHISPRLLSGGFIGVDIFFVISGFLITYHIFENLDKGQFSFIDFFGRRFRRIFPALITVVVCSLIFGYLALFDDEFTQLSKHVASGIAFIINFILVDESGYFDNVAKTKPMLHLWSLSVEEQFYIIWPLVLYLSWKSKFNLLIVTILVAVVSFYLNLRFIKSYPTEIFFWSVGRIWELLSGSVLAYLLLYKGEVTKQYSMLVDKYLVRIFDKKKEVGVDGSIVLNLISLIGLFMLLISVFVINDSLLFPSKWALIPVLGTVLVILSGSYSWLNRMIFMNPIAIWFGLISYPLYLWHWPILSFLHIIEDGVPSRYLRIFALFLSICFAWLTYQFIEKPIRFKLNKRISTIILSVTSFIVLLGSLQIYNSHKLLKSIDPHLQYFSYINNNYFKCENSEIYEKSTQISWRGFDRCWQSKKGEPTVILVGDSHAESYFVGFAETLKKKNVAYYIGGGRPSFNDPHFKAIFEQLSNVDGKGKTVVITTWYREDFYKYDLVNELREVAKMLKSLNYRVFILGDVPYFRSNPRICLSRVRLENWLNRSKNCKITTTDLAAQIEVYEPSLKQMALSENIGYLATNNSLLCIDHECSMLRDGVSLYRDSHHLNISGSKVVGGEFASRIEKFLYSN